ncbi:MAG: DUF3887 domain-containing protein [Prevotella sp.]|nr:DUF3887 domain-containing protein [Prevotella sp.]
MKKLLLMLLMACPLMAVAQETIDPGVARAEKMLGFVLQNQADSLYANLSDKVKGMVQKEQLENVLEQVEAQVGKYQKHGPWEIQEMMGVKAYVAPATFEKGEMAALVVFDPEGKMLAIQIVPAEAIKKG